MTRIRKITKAVQKYDSLLFARYEGGAIHIFRHCRDWRVESFGNGILVNVLYDNPWRVISLTTDWSVRSEPAEWGTDVIINRLKACDLWNQGLTVNDLKKSYDKWDQSRERELHNSVDSFLREFRTQFARATNDVNTSTLAKIDKRRLGDASYK
jgi:hypothetical protein